MVVIIGDGSRGSLPPSARHISAYFWILPLIINILIANTVFTISVYCIFMLLGIPSGVTWEVRSPPVGFGVDNLPYSV